MVWTSRVVFVPKLVLGLESLTWASAMAMRFVVMVMFTTADVLTAPKSSVARAVNPYVPTGALLHTML